MLLDPGADASDHKHGRHEHRPQLDAQHAQVVGRLRGGGDGGQLQQQNQIPAQTMVFVHLFRGLDAPKDERGEEELRAADGGLQHDDDVRDEAQDGVGRLETGLRMRGLVELDDDEGGEEGQVGQGDQAKVGEGAAFLLDGRARGLQDEDGLGGEEDAGRVEELAPPLHRLDTVVYSVDV